MPVMIKKSQYIIGVDRDGGLTLSHARTPGGLLYQNKQHSYVAKVQNGPYTRYFYSEKEYQAYLKNKNESKNKTGMSKEYSDWMNKNSVESKLSSHKEKAVGKSPEKMSDRDIEKELDQLGDEWKKLVKDGGKHKEERRNERRRNELYVEQANRSFKRTGQPDMTMGYHAHEGWLDQDLIDKLNASGHSEAWRKMYG